MYHMPDMSLLLSIVDLLLPPPLVGAGTVLTTICLSLSVC